MIFLVLLMVVPLGIALLTYAFFWYETASSAHRQYLEDLSNGRLRRLLVKGILSSYLSVLLTILLYPTGLWRRLWQPRLDPDCPRPPVILIHGLYHNVSAWTLFRRRLQAAGFANLYFLCYSSWNQTFPALVMKLEQLLAEVREHFPNQSPILIGHSLGGLLSRACAQSLGGPTRLAGVVTLGTPHKGSKMAALGLGTLARSLIYRGPLIDKLDEGKRKAATPCVALYSPIDNMVLPNQALQTTEAGWVHQETAPISHVAMLYHRQTAQLVLEYLKSMSNDEDG
jgi:triacylglycerol lipase